MESMNEPVEMIIYENLKKLIKYRKIETNYTFLSLEKFSSAMNTLQYEHIEGKSHDGHPVHIFLIQAEGKYGKKADDFKKLIQKDVKSNVNSEVLYITEKPVSSYILKKIIEYRDDNLINVFPYTYELFIIILPESDSSFKHEVADPVEFQLYCDRLIINKVNLPKIYATDPQLVWIGAKKNDVVKISGKSETAQEVEEFRFVI